MSGPAPAAQDATMASHPDFHRRATPEERRFLDALVFWRGLYAERGPRDREPVQALDVAISEAEGRMRSLRLGAGV
jgi:hypothetical protein